MSTREAGQDKQESLIFARIGNPRLYQHRYQSAQLDLWPPGEAEWFVIIRTEPPKRKHYLRRGRIVLLLPPLFSDGTHG